MELIFSIALVALGFVLLFCLVQLCMYKKVEGFKDIGFNKSIWYHAWYRYYNRFTGRVSHEYWNEFEDHSGIEIKIWHRENGFEWQLGCARESIRYINCSQHQLWFEFQTAYGWAEYKLDWDDICHHVELKFELPDEGICWRFGD